MKEDKDIARQAKRRSIMRAAIVITATFVLLAVMLLVYRSHNVGIIRAHVDELNGSSDNVLFAVNPEYADILEAKSGHAEFDGTNVVLKVSYTLRDGINADSLDLSPEALYGIYASGIYAANPNADGRWDKTFEAMTRLKALYEVRLDVDGKWGGLYKSFPDRLMADTSLFVTRADVVKGDFRLCGSEP